MAEIVNGLFGMNPQEYQRNQLAQKRAEAMQYSKLDPFEKATTAIYQGTQQGVDAGLNMMGVQDPELVKVSKIEQLASQFDLKDPMGMREFADSIKGFAPEQSMMAFKRADEMIKGNEEIIKGRALANLNTRKTMAEGKETKFIGVEGQPDLKQAVVVDKITNEVTPIGAPMSVYSSKTSNTFGGPKNVLALDAKMAEDYYKINQSAGDILPRLQEQKAQLASGIIGGSFADGRTALSTALSTMGLSTPAITAQLANSKAFKANSIGMAASVAKQLGVNPTDRDFAASSQRFAQNSDDPKAASIFLDDLIKIKSKEFNDSQAALQHFRENEGSFAGWTKPAPTSPLVNSASSMTTEELMALKEKLSKEKAK